LLGLDLEVAREAFRLLQGRETWAAHGAWIEAVRPTFGPDIAMRFAAAARITAAEADEARPVRQQARDAVVAATEGGRVLVVPAAAGPAPPLDADDAATAATRADTMLLTCIAGMAGAPAVVLPGARVDGLPVGVCFIGAPGSDRALLAWAASLAAPAPAPAPAPEDQA
jgi:amidase